MKMTTRVGLPFKILDKTFFTQSREEYFMIIEARNQRSAFKGRSRFVHEHSAENIIFGRKWDGRPGIVTENASNRSSLVVETCVTPF